MYRFACIVFLAAASLSLEAAPLALDRAAGAMTGMEASFTHHFTPKGFKTAQVEKGSVIFGTLPSMRWSYASPEKKLFVFDGTNSWFYVPSDRQVTVAKLTDARRSELPFLFLGDSASRDRHFVVKEQKRGNAIVATLQPKAARAVIRDVTVTISPSNHRIQRIEYSDRDGNRTSFDFSGYHRFQASSETFRFTPPAGVQVVRAD